MYTTFNPSTPSRKPRWVIFFAFLLVFTASLFVHPAAEAAPGWSAGGSLAVAREVHTATLLPDGRVLVVGGGRR